MLIGERLGSGYMMYRDLWDFTSPLAALVYKWIYLIFGRSRVPYFIFSIFLVICQAGIFNHMLLSNKAFSQSTYIPALLYVICMNLFLDFLTLPPVLMSMTFILLALNNIFKRMDNQTRDELFTTTGIYLGIATLFFLPSALCLIVTILALVLYTGSIFRRVLLLIYGYAVVLALVSLWFYYQDGVGHYHSFFYGALWNIRAYNFLEYRHLWVAGLLPMVLFIFSIVKIFQFGRYINFQVQIQFVMFYFFLAGFLVMIMVRTIASYQLIFFVPFFAFFLSHYLITIKNALFAEASALLFFVLLLVNHAATRDGWLIYQELVDYDKLIVAEEEKNPMLQDKKLWSLREDGIRDYSEASLATPFLDWQLSREVLENQNYFENNAFVYQGMISDLPDIIIDDYGIVQNIFERFPKIREQYNNVDVSGVYKRKN